ncbi:MAG: hypothetical protein JWN66_2598 [Sphingomonas bacterium]|uniref:DUF6551 family protein n=1 Tax=Sphingomonas bacterium TaxID=1895847 RepID=UPI00262F4E64|nr:DUF6551 family protein [Sphingomonas bacterium]MDB5705482.1 hypothetical protein [Sphingomonas bacterium]
MKIDNVPHTNRVPADVRVWRHGDPMPDWIVDAMNGPVAANGTFLVNATLGRQRVHRGNVVVEQLGQIYTCPLSGAQSLIRQNDMVKSVASDPKMIVGPGKSIRSSARQKTKGAAGSNRRRYPAARGAPPSIEWVNVGDLLVDDGYQRSIDTAPSRRLISSIASHWDWRLCMPLAVSRRESGKYDIDGQHRLAAAKLRGDLPHLPCCVGTYAGAADEAGMFVAANRARRAINRLDDFHAAIVAQDEDALEVNRIVNEAGLTVSRKTGALAWCPGEVAFTSSVQHVIARHGEEVASTALTILAQAFQGQILSNGASVFRSVARILTNPPTGFDISQLVTILSAQPLTAWSAHVQGVLGADARSMAMYRAIVVTCEQQPTRLQ